MDQTIKIILTDDKARYRHLVKEILEPFNVSVIGEADNGEECLKLLQAKIIPDIVLLDLEMPVMDGSKTLEQIMARFPSVKVVILSFYYDHLLIENFLARGASGYLIKDGILDTPVLLINALQKVFSGGTFIYEKPGERQPFTEKQKQIMPLIFEGKTNLEIAKNVGINRRTVERQRHKIYEITGVEKAIDFYKYAFSRGLQYLGFKK
ncbi:MAG TPA: response regulator transcription factor [Bacteroidia bacterium]|nr:response regulator transcription factor [Bacteroidia bacterium]